MKHKWLLVLLIIVVAAVFRLQHITTVPPGLYPDEAMEANDAVQALETGHYKVFYTADNGREGLYADLAALSFGVFGKHIWALRLVSAIAGILTVLGVYLLVNRLFNWKIAALSSYLTAISFWHVNFSRIGFRAILAPLFLVWALYFLWRGLSSSRLRDFAISGIFWGLGFYTYISFRIIPLVLILVLLAYWSMIKKDFAHDKYVYIRNQLIRGFAMIMVAMIIVALPIGFYFLTHPGDFFERTGQLSIFSSENPIKDLAFNTVKTLGMFNFIGDHNWRHNFAGSPELLWPVGVLFAIGFIKSIIKLFSARKKEGYFPTTQTLLLSWFFIGLTPVIFSNEGIPHALRAIIIVPAVFIFAGEGLWWIMDKIGDWYHARDVHEFHFKNRWLKESSVMAVIALVILLASFTITEYDKYFNKWAKDPRVAAAFSQDYVGLGEKLNTMSPKTKKYVIINGNSPLVNGIPLIAQTVMFVTDTATPEKQKAKNTYYLTEEQYRLGQYDTNSKIFKLEN